MRLRKKLRLEPYQRKWDFDSRTRFERFADFINAYVEIIFLIFLFGALTFFTIAAA